MSTGKSTDSLSVRQIEYLLDNWPDKHDRLPRPKAVSEAWHSVPAADITRLIKQMHDDESCSFHQPAPPFLKEQKIQALIAHQIAIPGSDVLPLTMEELRSLHDTYVDTASDISVRDSASQFSARSGSSELSAIADLQRQLAIVKRALRQQGDSEPDSDPSSTYAVHEDVEDIIPKSWLTNDPLPKKARRRLLRAHQGT